MYYSININQSIKSRMFEGPGKNVTKLSVENEHENSYIRLI